MNWEHEFIMKEIICIYLIKSQNSLLPPRAAWSWPLKFENRENLRNKHFKENSLHGRYWRSRDIKSGPPLLWFCDCLLLPSKQGTPLPSLSAAIGGIRQNLGWFEHKKMVQKQFATHLSFTWNWIAKTDLTNYCRSEMLGSPQNTILVISFAQGRGLTGYPQIPKSFSPKPLSLMGGGQHPLIDNPFFLPRFWWAINRRRLLALATCLSAKLLVVTSTSTSICCWKI